MRRRVLLRGSAAGAGLMALGPLAAACGSQGVGAREARSTAARVASESGSTSRLSELAQANTAMGWDIYRYLARTESGNLLLSPYSIGVALAMLTAGARGETEAELVRLLHVETFGDGLHPAFNAFDSAVTSSPSQDGASFELAVANSSWAQQGFHVEATYLDVLARFYGAGVRLVDFIGSPEAARREINRRVEEKTRDRIKDLLPKRSVTSNTRLVLANAVYFLADWLQQFPRESTSPGPFTLAGGTRKEVPMMRQIGSFGYARLGDVEALELPYAGNMASMVILLPPVGGLGALEESLSSLASGLTSALPQRPVEVQIPRWEFTADVDLKKVLPELGAGSMFDPGRADLSGINRKRGLYVTDAFQRRSSRSTKRARKQRPRRASSLVFPGRGASLPTGRSSFSSAIARRAPPCSRAGSSILTDRKQVKQEPGADDAAIVDRRATAMAER